jgi:hypothetical protein
VYYLAAKLSRSAAPNAVNVTAMVVGNMFER